MTTLNGHDYGADGTHTRDMTNGGHRTWWEPMLDDLMVEVGNAATSASDAAASAVDASTYAAALSGTSSTSTTIGTGSKSFTASTAKQWQVGQYVYVARSAAPTTYMAGQVTAYNSGTGALTVDVSATNGSGTYTDWVITIGGAKGTTGSINSLTESSKSTTYTLASGDLGTVMRLTSTWTLAFTAAATLGSGWWCYLSNEGTGDITLDPNASEQIDGLTSFVMYPGEVRKVWCDGSAFRSIVLRSFRKRFTASGTFTKPPGYSAFGGFAWGAGGGGGKSGSTNTTGGGGGGACLPFYLLSSAVGTTETVTIGTGGPGTSSAGNGTAGGNTTLGSLVTSYGGGAGAGNGAANRYGGGGGGALSAGSVGTAAAASGGDPNGSTTVGVSKDFGGGPSQERSVYGGGGGGDGNTAAGRSIYGGGGGAGGGSAPGAAGTSTFGGAGGAGSNAGNGAAGTQPGGGGGGTRTGTTSGAGADGAIEIWGVC